LKIDNQYIIPFKGLKEGIHRFPFHISGRFFEDYEKLDVPGGDISVQVKMDKKPALLDLEIEMEGKIEVQCDRCLEYFSMPVFYQGHLVVKFSETYKEPDDEVIFLHPDDNQMDLKHYFYECLFLSIPMRKVHPDRPDGTPGCDKEMLEKLREHLIE
jgi:uncharacterized protein